MARPTTKEELLARQREEYDKLSKTIDLFPEGKRDTEFLFEDRDRSVRDVVMHLVEWQKMMANWHKVGVIDGGVPKVPAEGFTWRTTPDLNMQIWQSIQDIPLDEALQHLARSDLAMRELIESHSNQELFSTNIYPWTKTTTLGAYFIGATSSHYAWATKKLRKQLRCLKQVAR